jgi:hypothetical protein
MVTVMKSRASDVRVFFTERVDFALYAARASRATISHHISMLILIIFQCNAHHIPKSPGRKSPRGVKPLFTSQSGEGRNIGRGDA